VFWGVAENYRFIPSLQHASSIVSSGVLGKISTFRTHMYASVGRGNLSFETAWRRKPEYQGGFVLDGGVHFVAATRMMLGPTEPIVRLSAFTKMTREYLPPVDTVDAVMKTKNGVTGTFSVSFGSSNNGSEYTVTGEEGYVTVYRGGNLQGKMGGTVVVKIGTDDETVTKFENDGNGVMEEVDAWAKALVGGKGLDARQTPENALKDLEIVSVAKSLHVLRL
jgi:predicted dehydrogenase